jgi:hypothetical protein
MKVSFVFDRPLDMAIIELGGNEHVCDTSRVRIKRMAHSDS